MADKIKELDELDLDAPTADLESAMREAEAAVESARGDEESEGADPGPGGYASPAGTTGSTGNMEIDRLRREIADLRDRSMRTLADFDNFRKRSERERQEARRYALFDPLREFVNVVDNLERALSAEGPAEDL